MNMSWLGRNKWYFIIGVPMVSFVLAPFPLGMGMIYPITDTLRGHPQSPHGTQPKNLVGFWMREESKKYDFLGTAFYLMPDGRFAGNGGMTSRRWHFDDDVLFVDAVSRCGNCFAGNVTSTHSIKFDGPDRLHIVKKDGNVERGIAGNYRRVKITDALKAEMTRLGQSKDDEEFFKGRAVMGAIDHFENLSKPR